LLDSAGFAAGVLPLSEPDDPEPPEESEDPEEDPFDDSAAAFVLERESVR
jgi:hypothetical protein